MPLPDIPIKVEVIEADDDPTSGADPSDETYLDGEDSSEDDSEMDALDSSDELLVASSGAGSSSTVDDEDRSAAEEEVLEPKSFRKSRKSTIKSSKLGEELTEEEDYEEGNLPCLQVLVPFDYH